MRRQNQTRSVNEEKNLQTELVSGDDTGVWWHETHMPLVSSNLFLCWCTHDSKTGGLHVHSYKHNLWCCACGSCPRIFRILCSLTQPVTWILSNLVLFNPLWYSLAVTSLHIPRYQWGCNQPRKPYKQMDTSSTSRPSFQGKRLEVANRNQWNSTQIAYLNNTILRVILKFLFRGKKLLFIMSNHLLRQIIVLLGSALSLKGSAFILVPNGEVSFL